MVGQRVVHFAGKTVLHVGCGGSPLPAWLEGASETRFDIDERHRPDVVGDMRDLDGLGPFDVIFNSHCLEHLYPHEVVPTLAKFRAALAPGGVVFAVVPNLDGIRPTEDVVYDSPCGPITGLDMYYGCRRLIADMPHMAHHTAFVPATLAKAFEEAGFGNVVVKADDAFNLIAAGVA